LCQSDGAGLVELDDIPIAQIPRRACSSTYGPFRPAAYTSRLRQ
jgi:hypothetical protein